ncbi:hypothetical protein [Schumannella soli]|uniref:Uncharacterized protein n=1 Tax=Schumannella soli TaxID=2590779 RepID=A0A506XT44_9MICO|nr:hypothetical protein [Schumannella soli]TPW75871.1 hypothetical protein FJ657_08420 [Schumannella soli]
MRLRPLVSAALVLALLLTIGAVAVAVGPRLDGAEIRPSGVDPGAAAREEASLRYEARDAIRDYREISDRVGQAGWIEVEPLRDAVSAIRFEQERRDADTRRAGGWVQLGDTEVAEVRIEAEDRVKGRVVRVRATACIDSEAARVQRIADGAIDALTHPARQRLSFVLQRYRERGTLRVVSIDQVDATPTARASDDRAGAGGGMRADPC